MSKKNYLYFLCLLFFNQSFAQIKMTGQVVDSQNNPISSAKVDLVGSNSSGITDNSGVFFLTLPVEIKKGDPVTFRVSKLGYRAVTKHTPASPLSLSIRISKDLSINAKTNPKSVEQSQSSLPTKVENQPNNVTSYFQSGGITAGQVVVAPPARKLSQDNYDQLINLLPDKNEKIDITSIMGDSEAFQLATQISDFLKYQGYKAVNGVNQGVYNGPVFGQQVSRDSLGVKIIIGARQ